MDKLKEGQIEIMNCTEAIEKQKAIIQSHKSTIQREEQRLTKG